jgi:hypothetical protein
VVIKADSGITPIKFAPAGGASITLDASASHDPDGDRLKFSWWVLSEAGTYGKDVNIPGRDSARATIAVPSDADGKSIHVICEVTDDGIPNLTSYRRIVVHPTGTATRVSLPPKPSAVTRLRVVMSSDFPPIGVVKGGSVPNTQKSDPDDMQSMVRFLLYANEFDIEGLIASAGTFANVANKQNILDVIDRYERVYDNLKKRDPRYPKPGHLRSVTFQGLSGTWGKKGTENIGPDKDSEASEALIAIVDKPDPRPVYIGIWGDCSVIAQAVWKVQNTRSAAELETFLSKLRIHQTATQDGTIGWLRDTFPTLFIIHSAKTYQGMFGGKDPLSNLAWVNEHIRFNHGPLCDVYPHEGMGCTGVCEGDSPSFLWLVSANRGLNDPDDPTRESWGGQFKKDGNKNHYVDGPGGSSVSKWRADYQNEFAERADWCVEAAPASVPTATPMAAPESTVIPSV